MEDGGLVLFLYQNLPKFAFRHFSVFRVLTNNFIPQ